MYILFVYICVYMCIHVYICVYMIRHDLSLCEQWPWSQRSSGKKSSLTSWSVVVVDSAVPYCITKIKNKYII